MVQVSIDPETLSSLQAAIARNPESVKRHVRQYLQSGEVLLRRTINRSPWRMGGTGGGAPVDTGNLRENHQKKISPFSVEIFPTPDYAEAVHGVDGVPRKRTYQLRPWLDYAMQTNQNNLQQLEGRLLDNIVRDLAR